MMTNINIQEVTQAFDVIERYVGGLPATFEAGVIQGTLASCKPWVYRPDMDTRGATAYNKTRSLAGDNLGSSRALHASAKGRKPRKT